MNCPKIVLGHNTNNHFKIYKDNVSDLHVMNLSLNLHTVKLTRERVYEEEEFLWDTTMACRGSEREGNGGGGKWVSGGRGLDPCHCFVLH